MPDRHAVTARARGGCKLSWFQAMSFPRGAFFAGPATCWGYGWWGTSELTANAGAPQPQH
eukprot:1585376-Lingulodinium_polyedra.AAC.1